MGEVNGHESAPALSLSPSLPGTPTSDTGSFKIKLSDGGQGKRLELSVSLDPVSPCSSSVSSEQSAKSNDLLLPGNKAGRNDDQ